MIGGDRRTLSLRAARRCGALVVLAMLATTALARGFSFEPVRFEVSARGLVVRGDLFGRALPRDALQVQAARAVDLDQEPQYRLAYKIAGTSLPGYHSGWFRLEDGEKALVFLTRSRWVVHIPTTRGYAVVVSPERPQEFLDALRSPGEGVRAFRIAEGR